MTIEVTDPHQLQWALVLWKRNRRGKLVWVADNNKILLYTTQRSAVDASDGTSRPIRVKVWIEPLEAE